jgi:hypothetical protein
MSKETKIAIIGGIFGILAAVIGAVIGGIFLLRGTAPVQSNATPTPSLVSSTSAPTQSNSSTTFPPVATQTAQPTYSDIRGTYSLYYQNSGTSFGATLQITQQNQQNFQGTLTNSTASFPINRGTVYQNGDIRFVIIESDSAGNQITITYTGTGEAGTGWHGTWSGSNGTQGTWYTTGRLFMP